MKRKTRKRSEGAKAAYRQWLGPSYAFLEDLFTLLGHWKDDVAGRSNAFFRAFAWHRRNILWAEVGRDASRVGQNLTQEDYIARVYAKLRSEMDDLNVRTGRRIDDLKMRGYLAVAFPDKPPTTSVWAKDLGVDGALARELGLITILPAAERKYRTEAKERKKQQRRTETDLKNKKLDEMILSGREYDFSVFTKEQVKYRRGKLIEVGKVVPVRRRGRRK